MRQRETNICMLSGDEQILASVYPTPQGGAGTQADQVNLFCICSGTLWVFSPDLSQPSGGVWFGR